MERFHAKGLISNPVGKAKSVALSEEGLGQAKAASEKLFEDDPNPARDITVPQH
jgi:hypothetical protein